MLIDHLVYAVPDLPAAVADLAERFGVEARAGGRHLGRGTHNALLALGPRRIWRSSPPTPNSPTQPFPAPSGSTASATAAW